MVGGEMGMTEVCRSNNKREKKSGGFEESILADF